ncbi:MAG: hypothetical protein GTN93_07330, partial [Anaerolineae bacterium]|nr:hypothetical protein [Anaerolineae bacterium]
ECKINQVLREGGLPLGPGWINEPQYDMLSPEEIASEIDPNYPPQKAIDDCPVRLGLFIDQGGDYKDCPECHGQGCESCQNEDGSGMRTQGTLLTAALLRMREVAKDIGTDMMGLDLAIGEILNPQLPWEVELRQYFQETIGSQGRTYLRPNRRS